VAAALLVALALAGCGRRGAASTPTPAGVEAGTQVGDGPSGNVATSSIYSAGSPAGKPTTDPVASELDQINQLINDIDNSVNSSDSSSDGGE
jgi:predicted small lipoprotein YifL